MGARATLALMILLAVSAAPRAYAVGVTIYGTGLEPCGTYLDARDQQIESEVAFVDWLSGYLSGVNATSKHMNDLLGSQNLSGAVYWVGKYCRLHPKEPYSVAAYALLMGASAATAAQDSSAASYGIGFKSCQDYVSARLQQNTDAMAFIDWFGGYLSGVNAISMRTTNVLGDSAFPQAIGWLDNYCRANPQARFAAAVDARVGNTPIDQTASTR